jgi:hypothetical protein
MISSYHIMMFMWAYQAYQEGQERRRGEGSARQQQRRHSHDHAYAMKHDKEGINLSLLQLDFDPYNDLAGSQDGQKMHSDYR